MARSRVLSFMSAFSGIPKDIPSQSPSPSPQPPKSHPSFETLATPSKDSVSMDGGVASTLPTTRAERPSSRPVSMVYQSPLTDSSRETIPELIPIFTFLNSHANKLYQEGYFLKLNDLDINGKPNMDRTWTESFAQLVGTVLSLWDAAALDAAGSDGEVAPTFINMADASIKMIETLPTRNQGVQPLQNVLSISTAGKNRYLLHFNSLHSLTQWTAGIRLAMFEHSSLLELYTGSLIAGKGKHLNNIRVIMERTKVRTEDWARVRFGAGTPWRRCWCVIEPPDEKEYQKTHKSSKKRSAYDKPRVLKGDIKFYDSKKVKKASPIATITDAYSAYAIYPQSKPLIDQSTLVKVEGRITIHSQPESKTEGFVFVMPEVHPAVTGFEMMLRWLFPVYDVFNLYGRPSRLIADTLDTRGLMFAMPQERRYGYLDIIDVAGLIHTDKSQDWSEREWRQQIKEITLRRMKNAPPSRHSSRVGSTKGHRASLPINPGGTLDDNASTRSSPSLRHQHNQSTDTISATPQDNMTPPQDGLYTPPAHNYHARSFSDTAGFQTPTRRRQEGYVPSRLSVDQESEAVEAAPLPPTHGRTYINGTPHGNEHTNSTDSSDSDQRQLPLASPEDINRDMEPMAPPIPVAPPPELTHQATDRPSKRPNPRDDIRRFNSRMSTATFSQLVDASKMGHPNGTIAAAGASAAWKTREMGHGEDHGSRGVIATPAGPEAIADQQPGNEGLVVESLSKVANLSDQSDDISSLATPQQPEKFSRPGIHQPSTQNPTLATDDHTLTTSGAGLANLAIPTKPASDQVLVGEQLPASFIKDNISGEYHGGDESETTQDYSSTQRPIEPKRSERVYKPRTGVLKTAGNPDLSTAAAAVPNFDIPFVDFGPTQSLNPNDRSRPVTPAGAVTQHKASHSRTPSDSLTPQDDKRISYLGRSSPVVDSVSHNQPRSPSNPERVLAWQPGAVMGSGPHSPGSRITPEEFVQLRASAKCAGTPEYARPIYAHQRNRSSGNLPIERPGSGDWSKRKDFPARPISRSASYNLAQQRDYSSHLSAREQEHVARMTGSPLLKMPAKPRTPSPSAGLVGAIQAREKEKRNMKEGLSGQMVQHAIVRRQQQAHAQAQAHLQAQMQAQQGAQMAYGYPQQQRNVYGESFSPGHPASWGSQNYENSPQGATRQPLAIWNTAAAQQNLQRQHTQGYANYHGRPNARPG